MSTTILKDNKSIHENNQFHIIEGLYDSIFERMDNQLKKLDSSYMMTFSGIYNNKLIMFLTARITEFSKEEQNKVAMYLVNSV